MELTKKQETILKLYNQGMKPVEIQRELGYPYLGSVNQTIYALKLKGLIENERTRPIEPICSNNN